MSSSPPRSPSPSSFLSHELRVALAEQHFGIRSFTMLPTTTTLSARALVILLDGKKLHVSLNNRGYVVEGDLNQKSLEVFETVEGLLGSASDLYEQRRMELLFSKLREI